jgi:hypothetical protein
MQRQVQHREKEIEVTGPPEEAIRALQSFVSLVREQPADYPRSEMVLFLPQEKTAGPGQLGVRVSPHGPFPPVRVLCMPGGPRDGQQLHTPDPTRNGKDGAGATPMRGNDKIRECHA